MIGAQTLDSTATRPCENTDDTKAAKYYTSRLHSDPEHTKEGWEAPQDSGGWQWGKWHTSAGGVGSEGPRVAPDIRFLGGKWKEHDAVRAGDAAHSMHH